MPCYLGRSENKKVEIPVEDLTTHAFICGVTGSGKTVLGKILLEECTLQGIPSLVFDFKGDISSLAIPIVSAQEQEFAPWISEPHLSPSTIQQDFVKNLHRFDLHEANLKDFRRKADIRLFTPRSKKGIPLGYSPLLDKPEEPEMAEEVASFSSFNIIGLLYEKDSPRFDIQKAFIKEVIKYLWNEGEELQGIEGIKKLIHYVAKPPFQKIGERNLDDFIQSKKIEELANKLNSLIINQPNIFEGIRADNIEQIILTEDGKTPISIINLTELNTFQERVAIVSQIGYGIYHWMRQRGETSKPRLLLYVDEIGGGGGKEALFPSHPYQPLSKSPLQLLLRQGRSFGVSCVFATQNPGDIDYKALSNCQTWFIGRLPTQRDREKILQGIKDAEITDEIGREMENRILGLTSGEFLMKTKQNDVVIFQERWLLSFHKTLSAKELEILAQGKPEIPFQVDEKIIGAYETLHFAQGKAEEALVPINQSCKIRPEVLEDRLIGIISLSDAETEGTPENDPDWVFGNTYATQDIINTLHSLKHKLEKTEQRGAYVFLGHYGSGKSHALLFLYHFFKHRKMAEKWLKAQDITMEFSTLPSPFTLISSLHSENYLNLWDKLYEKLKRPKNFVDYPKRKDLETLLGNNPTFIFWDELEGFLESIADPARKKQNLMFLQVLTELSLKRDNLFVFLSLLGRNEEVAAILNRANPFQKLLHLSHEKEKVLKFRLFEEIREDYRDKIASSYLSFYKIHSILLGRLLELKERFRDTFPVHPDFLDVFYIKVSGAHAWNQTRGLLYLLGSVLRENYKTKEAILLSDINLDHDDLAQLDRDLVERAKGDVERTKDIPEAKGLLTSILVHSLAEQNLRGAAIDNLALSVLRPSSNYNDFTYALNQLPENCVYVWQEAGKFFIRRRENIQALINEQAKNILEEALQKEDKERKELFLPFIIELRKQARYREVLIYPFDNIEDSIDFKIMVSLKFLPEEEMDKLPLRYQNSLAFVIPDEDLITRRDISELLAKIKAADEKKAEVSQELKGQIIEIEGKLKDELKELVENIPFSLIRSFKDETGKLHKKKEKVTIKDVVDKINTIYDRVRIEEEIKDSLERSKETGVSLPDLLNEWSRLKGKPFLTEEVREKIGDYLAQSEKEKKVEKKKWGGKEVYVLVDKPKKEEKVEEKITVEVEEIRETLPMGQLLQKLEEKAYSYSHAEGSFIFNITGDEAREALEKILKIDKLSLDSLSLTLSFKEEEVRTFLRDILTKLPRPKGDVEGRITFKREKK